MKEDEILVQRLKTNAKSRVLLLMLTCAPALVGGLVGCAGYHVGSFTMYPQHIRTVHVPVFESESLRLGLGPWLTEAVVKEIELKTNYKVVPRERAETILEGRIVQDLKRTTIETINGDPRNTLTTMKVQVRWVNSQGQPIQPGVAIEIPGLLSDLQQTSRLVPEVGQSTVTAQQESIHRLAEQIVAMMEVPW